MSTRNIITQLIMLYAVILVIAVYISSIGYTVPYVDYIVVGGAVVAVITMLMLTTFPEAKQ